MFEVPTEITQNSLLRAFLEWFKSQPMMPALLLLMVLDILVGTCLSIVKRTLSSAISWRGMSRKIIMLLIVATAGVLQMFIPSIPMLNVASFFYAVTEGISILENAAAAGVPLPKGLVETLAKLREQSRLMSDQKVTPPGITINQVNVQPSATTTDSTIVKP